MTITAAIVVFAVTWFMVFFCVLPLRFQSQGDAGDVVPGTPKSAPSSENVGKKAKITTAVAVVLWAIICGIILSGWITVQDFDFRGTMAHTTEG
jgi:predicted secreted protein